MQTTIKRLLALILALSMCLSLLSVNVWAADSSGDASGDVSVQEEASGEGSDSSADGSESETEDISASDTAEAEEVAEVEPEEEESEEVEEEAEEVEEVEPEEEEPEEEVSPEEEVTVQETVSNISYMEGKYQNNTLTFTQKTASSCTVVESSTTTWSSGWYVVNTPSADNLTISGRITVDGTVNLILCDGAKLTASNGIKVTGSNSLTVYAQSYGDDMGKLIAKAGTGTGHAGIGGNKSTSSEDASYAGGNLTIHGGTVTATGSAGSGGGAAAGIGGGSNKGCGTVTVYGGIVNATGAQYNNVYYSAGIGGGGGYYGDGGTVIIYGGIVTATGGHNATVGIGHGGTSPNNGTLTLGKDVKLETSTDNSSWTDTTSTPDTRTQYMRTTGPMPHTHSFTYSLNSAGNIITATCTGDGCTLPEVDDKHIATLTIAAPTTGNDAVITVSPEGVLTRYTLRYQTKSGGTWGAETNTAPSAAGIHKANVTLGGVTASVSWGNNCITYADNLSNGSITGATSATCGAAVEPTITPDTGYELDALTVTPEQGSGVTSVELTADGTGFVMPEANVTVSATFKKINSAITVTQPTAGGTVTARKDNADVTTADYGDTITLGNTPADGYTFDSYTVTKTGDSSTSVAVNNGTFSMPPYPVTVTAAFTAIDYTVTVTQPEAGGTIGASKTTANVGNEITLSVTPAAGYELDTLTVTDANNQDVTVTDNKFTMPASAVTVTAAFTAIDYTIAIAETTNGSVTTTTDLTGVFHIGDEVTLTVAPDKNYGLKSITTTSGTLAQTDVNQETGALTYVLTMGAGDATVTAEFSTLTSYTIFYNASGSPDAVSVRLTGNDGEGYPMSSSAKLGNIDCWSTQVLGGEGSASLAFSIKEGTGDWTTLDIPVVDSVPNTLAAGSAVAIEGEVNAFAVAFVWGEDADTDSLYYLVTPNTQSVDVPNPADTASESFAGWTYLAPSSQEGKEAEEVTVDKGTGSSTTVSLDKITQTTIVGAIWMPASYTIHFDPDNGENATTQSVTYGSTVSKPANPTKAGYEFDCWVLADNAVEMSGDKTVQLSPGTAFDFNLKIMNNLSLKAKWKHVHSYVCLPLDHSTFGGAFADYYGYKGQLHIKLCTSMDDYCAEAHSFVNGKCACGASILDNKVKLTKKVGSTTSESNVVKNSIVSITAPEKQSSQTFSKWQYSTNDATWYDLTTMRGVAFAIPASMSVKAVYEQDRFKLTMNSFKYDSSHVAYQFNYSVPDGFTVVDGGLMLGDNVRMRFWDCTLNLFFLGHVREPSLRDAVKVYGGGTIASKMFNYQTINEPGSARPIKKALKTFGKTGTVAMAWQPYTSEGYKEALHTREVNENYNQAKYPTYAMGYIVCKDNRTGGYVGFMTNAISATLESPTHSDVTEIPVS